MRKNELKSLVLNAFSDVPYPGDDLLVVPSKREEPQLTRSAFLGKRDWAAIPADFLDQAPDGFGSALSFFSPMAFRFYLPAYVISDIEGKLERVNPLFYLCDDFTEESSWDDEEDDLSRIREEAARRFEPIQAKEAGAIVEYLKFSLDRSDDFYDESIKNALSRFWIGHADKIRRATG